LQRPVNVRLRTRKKTPPEKSGGVFRLQRNALVANLVAKFSCKI